MEPFLDRFVKPGITALLKLSRGPLATEPLVATACKYRLLRDALSGVGHQTKKKTYAAVVADYPVILSDKYARAAVKYAALAISALTAGPRKKGLMIGTAASAALFAIYFLAGPRAALSLVLGKHVLAADILLWIIACSGSIFLIRTLAAQRLKALLPQASAKTKGLPPAEQQLWQALGITLLLWLLCAVFTSPPPLWLASLTGK
jgi:hypothetical protein